MIRRSVPLAALILLAACAGQPPKGPVCPEGMTPMLSDTLYFGTARAGGVVSAVEWERFVRDEIATRFPQGYTVQEAEGQWRNADGSIAYEHSHLLVVVHPADKDEHSDLAMQRIADTYKTLFGQQAVLRARSDTCSPLP
ncbi:MAG: DUF3574 domain-containing protein [Nevskia sp.]|nr:DUF3574 domain-containing protein [Nevskia sp.]